MLDFIFAAFMLTNVFSCLLLELCQVAISQIMLMAGDIAQA
jgi:hypothetical protein